MPTSLASKTELLDQPILDLLDDCYFNHNITFISFELHLPLLHGVPHSSVRYPPLFMFFTQSHPHDEKSYYNYIPFFLLLLLPLDISTYPCIIPHLGI